MSRGDPVQSRRYNRMEPVQTDQPVMNTTKSSNILIEQANVVKF